MKKNVVFQKRSRMGVGRASKVGGRQTWNFFYGQRTALSGNQLAGQYLFLVSARCGQGEATDQQHRMHMYPAMTS